ncbi:glycosyltransferase involved in cell wall biosynthesis [Rhizobium aquaticum]|uniref:Glycosyltransferase involved in cell wall biosynthesis n=1 Tax=Rhizobium aquaticum TaxID=1549636 RepID=A0ABV2J2F5_9HYPH
MSTIILLWENFGPMHDDRVRALVRACGGKARIVGLELFGKSDTYAWDNEAGDDFEKITLFPGQSHSLSRTLKIAAVIVRHCRALNADQVFLCHYELPAILLAACMLRLLGMKVYAMGDAKFDAYKRHLWREVGKSFFFLPYVGALSNEVRSKDYLRFLGIKAGRIAAPYNTISIDRLRRLSGTVPAPNGAAFADRHFTIVARFVREKNLEMALEAYAIYCRAADAPRQLHLCGSGELEPLLRQKVEELGLRDLVEFRGFLQSDGIAQALGTTLALILPSVQETFGFVVIEAQAMGLPVLVSENCGSRDTLVRTGVNGFVIEPDNPNGLAFFMSLLGRDEALWQRMCVSASSFAEKGDVDRFAEAVMTLVADF